ncbi:hypothetical protein HN873_047893 [Arachis hypogaea]
MNVIALVKLMVLCLLIWEKIHGALHDFNELLPPATTIEKELEQSISFFMILALYGLPRTLEYSSTCLYMVAVERQKKNREKILAEALNMELGESNGKDV